MLVRRAFNHAINKQDVLDAAIEGLGQVAFGFLSPTIPGYWPEMEQYAPAFDPEQAKALLTEAGWVANGDGRLEKDGQPFEFTLLNLPTDAWNRGAQVIQSQLDDIGISMEIQQMEFATLLEEAKAKNHDAEMMGYTYADPDIAFLWFHSSNAGAGLNMSHINDPVLDEMIIRGRSTIDPTERAAVYAEMQQYVSDLALWVPLWMRPVLRGLQQVHPQRQLPSRQLHGLLRRLDRLADDGLSPPAHRIGDPGPDRGLHRVVHDEPSRAR